MMIEKYKIEKDIPIPPKKGPLKYPFDKMEVGDSFVIYEKVTKQELNKYQSAAYHWSKRKKLNRKYVARKINENEIRIWRIK